MARSERDRQILSETYMYENPFTGMQTEYLITTLPVNLSENGNFTIGVSVESDHYVSQIKNILWQNGIASLFVILGAVLMSHLVVLKFRKSKEKEEKIETLKKELQTLEELSHHQRLELLGTMSGSIAHDLRNILTPIMGYSMMLMNKIPEEASDMQDDVAEIYHAADQVKRLTNRFLALSKKSNEKAFIRVKPDDIILQTAELANPIKPENITVIQGLACSDREIMADQTQLVQAILNIGINAFQAMEKDGGTFTVSTKAEDEAAVFTFRDTGPGIPEDVLPKIFDPFFSTKGVENGTGLGLAIVKHIIEEHGGTITAESEPGKGTEIRFTIPFVGEE